MRNTVIDVIAGTTLKLTWINSGVTPDSISMNLLDRDEVVVSSSTPVSSGNGHYYALLQVPSSAAAWYVGRSIALVSPNSYVNRVLVRARRLEVD